MNLQHLKLAHQTSHIQFITIDNRGVVLESDNILFTLDTNQNLFEVHPFFESLLELFPLSENLSLSCVHLEVKGTKLTCDIEIKPISKTLILIIITDFSKYYESFQSLVQSRNESTLESESLELKNRILKEKEAFKNKFIANFNHEVRSPITSIISFSNLLKGTKLNDEQKDYLNVISSSSFHLKSIINDILDISKIETGKLVINHSRFDLHALIQKIATEYRLECKHKNLGFNYSIDKGTPRFIESDATRLSQIIQNLLGNAIKFTSEGRITLQIKKRFSRAQNMTLTIAVSDSGIGIEKHNLKTIFERFTRLENADNTDGVGLGLAIVKEIVELMEGDLHVESKPDKGTTFTVNVKVKSSLDQKEQPLKSNKKIFLPKSKRKYNVLLVEDNTTHQLGIFKILAASKLFYLDIVSNGLDAIKAFGNSKYDVILMDYNLPILNGLDTSKAIKNHNDKQKSKTPIILITSQLITNELEQQKGGLFYDIIEKPFDEEALVHVIQKCLK